MPLETIDEFDAITVALGDFEFFRAYLVNHKAFLMCAIVEHDQGMDQRTTAYKTKMASVAGLADAMRTAMLDGSEDDMVSSYVLAWGNRNMTSVYARHPKDGDAWRPETASSPVGLKEVVPMDDAALRSISNQIAGTLAELDANFTRL